MSVYDLLTGGTPESKSWCNPVFNNLVCNNITCNTINNGGVSEQAILLKDPSDQITFQQGGSGNSNIINSSQPSGIGDITFNIPDMSLAGASMDFVFTKGEQTLNGEKTFSESTTFTSSTNQIVIKPSDLNSINITASNPSGLRNYTIPDVGFDADFILSQGNQGIAGQKTFTNTISAPSLLLPTNSNQIQFNAGTFVTTINVPLPGLGNNTYTIPDAGINADFVLTAGNQTIGGVLQFSNNVYFSGDLILQPGGPPQGQFFISPDIGVGTTRTYNIVDVGVDSIFMTGIKQRSILDVSTPIVTEFSGAQLYYSSASGAINLTFSTNKAGEDYDFICADNSSLSVSFIFPSVSGCIFTLTSTNTAITTSPVTFTNPTIGDRIKVTCDGNQYYITAWTNSYP